MKTAAVPATAAAEWDRLLEAQGGSLLQSWTWGALQSRFGWRVERLWFDDGATGLCSWQVAPAMVPTRTIAYVPRGPAVLPSARRAVTEELIRRAGSQHALAVRVEPEASAGDTWAELLPAMGWSPAPPVQPLVTSLVDLRPAAERLRATFKPKTRYNLGLSERKGVTVASNQDVAAFARLSATTARRQGIHLPGADYYHALLELFGPDRARLYLASHEGRLLAGIVVVRFARTATYLFGGSSDQGRELMPNYLLHWHAMLDFKAMGCEVYDWWGIPDNPAPDHPWAGLYQFKAGFGGTVVRYVGLYERVLRPLAWGLERRLRKLKTWPMRTILG